MNPVLCIIGGCNGAGKTTLARELLPRLGLRRFLNADEIARGLSPLDPSLCAFRAGRLLLEEARALIQAGTSFAIESTLSGKTYLALIREAKARGYRFHLHYLIIGSATQAVSRVDLRVRLGGHHVPEADIRRRFDRSRRHWTHDYLPLADEWVLWDNQVPPPRQVADNKTHTLDQVQAMFTSNTLQEAPLREMSEMSKIGLEAGRVATEKMLDYYKRMGIKVTPEMTLAPEKPVRKARSKTKVKAP
ncbi:AAA family ATPase [Prosthecobacter sp. SYSU 5D2]|uniref:zeta toxin family protein n=1 Tax=Prosthecobacter sp. SYSU 5D2 TaxID=3134134 RepID=UPI0031FF1802